VLREVHDRYDVQVEQVELRFEIRAAYECTTDAYTGIDCGRVEGPPVGLDPLVERADSITRGKVDRTNVEVGVPDLLLQFLRGLEELSSCSAASRTSNPPCANCLASSNPIPLDAPVTSA
jgi:hypothetical protein